MSSEKPLYKSEILNSEPVDSQSLLNSFVGISSPSLFSPDFDLKSRLKELYQQTLAYQQANKRGAFPYQDYDFLQLICSLKQPKRILELGSALGLSSIAMALSSSQSQIVSVDKNEVAQQLAQNNAQSFKVNHQIQFCHSTFVDYLQSCDSRFDLIFFDGFAPEFELFKLMESQLVVGGAMISANLNLNKKDKTGQPFLDTQQCIERMQDQSLYSNYFFFADTAIAIKR